MAKEGGNNEIGSVSVGVKANIEPLKQGMEEAKATVEATGAEIAASSNKIGSAVAASTTKAAVVTKAATQSVARETKTSMAEVQASTTQAATSVAAATEKKVNSFRKQTTEVRSLIGVYTKLASAAGALVSIGNAVVEVYRYVTIVFGDGTKAAEKFLATISVGAGKDAEARLEAIREQIQGVQSELARASEAPFLVQRGGRTRATIEADLERLRLSERRTSQQVRAQQMEAKREAEREKADKAASEAAKSRADTLAKADALTRNLNGSLLSQSEQIEANYQAALDLAQQAAGLGDVDAAGRLTRAAEAVRQRDHDLLARAMGKEMTRVGRQITDDMRNHLRETARSVVSDVRILGPKLDILNRSASRYSGRG